jgi:hypothetical protein
MQAIRAIAIKFPTVSDFHDRQPEESLKAYVERQLPLKRDLIAKIVAAALTKGYMSPDTVTFVVAPEFYWNPSWNAVADTELGELASVLMTEVPEMVGKLVKDLPVNRYGKVVLLAGSAACLIALPEKQGVDEDTWEALNFSVCGTNVATSGSDVPQLSMWPKKSVSKIDFGTAAPGGTEQFWEFRLGKRAQRLLKVKTSSSFAASHNEGEQFARKFGNDIEGVPPFGIDICLDFFQHAQAGGADRNLTEMINARRPIDFLMATGFRLPLKRPTLPEGLKYVVRVDGVMYFGECEMRTAADWKTVAPKAVLMAPDVDADIAPLVPHYAVEFAEEWELAKIFDIPVDVL